MKMDDYLGTGDANDVAVHRAMQDKYIEPLADAVRKEIDIRGEIAGKKKDIKKLEELVSKVISIQEKFASTYSLKEYPDYKTGVNELRKTGEKPFNLRRNWEARLDNIELFNTYQDSTTGIIYGGGSKFKVDLDCEDLEKISMKFKSSCMNVDYEQHKGKEYDMNKVICNRDLTEKEFLSHKVYLDILGIDLMKKIAHEVYHVQGRKTALAFILRNNTEKGKLQSLMLGYGSDNSYAVDRSDLIYKARFIRVKSQR